MKMSPEPYALPPNMLYAASIIVGTSEGKVIIVLLNEDGEPFACAPLEASTAERLLVGPIEAAIMSLRSVN